MDSRLTEVLVCPQCKGPLTYVREKNELHCAKCVLGYPIVGDIPVMLVKEARELDPQELREARVQPVQA